MSLAEHSSGSGAHNVRSASNGMARKCTPRILKASNIPPSCIPRIWPDSDSDQGNASLDVTELTKAHPPVRTTHYCTFEMPS